MECRLQRDFRIVQPVGLELYLGPTGAATEEIDSTTFTDHIHRPFPGFGFAYGCNDDVASAFLRRKGSYRIHDISSLGRLNDLVRAHLACGFNLAIALYDGNDVASNRARDLNLFFNDPAPTENCDGVADF